VIGFVSGLLSPGANSQLYLSYSCHFLTLRLDIPAESRGVLIELFGYHDCLAGQLDAKQL
jgi:hypothetical protein